MKRIHWNKVLAIADTKTRAFLGKNCIIMPIFAVGFTLLMRFLYTYIIGDEVGISGFSNGYALGMGLTMNICMTGIYCPALLLAEEKEKNTLRALMTSSVNGLEFFLGSIIPVFLAGAVLNFLLIPISGYSMQTTAIPMFTLVNILCMLISCVIGMLLGIFAKNQVTAGTLLSPVMMVFMLIPMFSMIIEVLKRISEFVFTGIMMELIMGLAMGRGVTITGLQLGVMGAELIAAIVLFMAAYKKNGFEKD